LKAPSRPFTPFEVLGFCLLVTLAATCSFDSGRLRASAPKDGAVQSPTVTDTGALGGNGDTAVSLDAPTAPSKGGDAAQSGGSADVGGASGAGSSDAPAATKDASSPIETGTTSIIDSPIATGGVDGTDAPVGAGGTGGGENAGAGGAAGSTGSDTTAASGGSATYDASDGPTPTGGVDGTDAPVGAGGTGGGGNAGAGGVAGSTGSDTTAASGGSATYDASDGPTPTGGAGSSGGQTDTGGAGAGGSGGAAGAAGPDGGISCSSQCPPTATVGITGVWGATYSNGSSGTVVTPGNATFTNWLTARGTNCVVQNLDITGKNYLTSARIAPYQILIVLDIYHTLADKNAFLNAKKTNTGYPAYPGSQRALQASEVNAVASWVANGGGLMTTIGIASTAAEMTNANLLLSPFGIAYSVTNVNVLPGNSTVTTFSTAAPIASQITTGVNTLPVSGGAGIEGLAGGPLPINSSTFSLYASASNGGGRGGYGGSIYVLGVATISNGMGRINVWGDETITYDAAWGNSAYQVQTYWNNVLTWLGQCP
jgi:hypothetical protein